MDSKKSQQKLTSEFNTTDIHGYAEGEADGQKRYRDRAQVRCRDRAEVIEREREGEREREREK